MVSTYRLTFALAAILLLGSIAAAQPSDPPEAMDAPADRMADTVVERIDMTEEQAEAVRAIYAASADRRIALAEQVQALRESERSRRERFRQMRALREELQTYQSKTRAELAGVLTDQQMQEFDAMMQARREAMRDAMRERRPQE